MRWRHVARLYFAVALLLLCLQTLDLFNMAMLSMLLALLIRMRDGHIYALWRMLGLLKWLLLPVFLIHVMFTPGDILFSLSSLYITREGVLQGAVMSLHLLMFFLAGMTISKLWTQKDWLLLAVRIPVIGRRLYPYMLVIMPLRQSMGQSLRLMRAQWHQCSGRWRHFPWLLESLVRQAVRLGERHAEMLWLRWGAQPAADMQLSMIPVAEMVAWYLLATAMLLWGWRV